mgnify:CR=1 FL=1
MIGTKNIVRVISLFYQEMDALSGGKSLGWVYVDGDHREKVVRADIKAYWPKVKDGGLMIFDDYDFPCKWNDGITKACDAFFQSWTHCELPRCPLRLLFKKRT